MIRLAAVPLIRHFELGLTNSLWVLVENENRGERCAGLGSILKHFSLTTGSVLTQRWDGRGQTNKHDAAGIEGYTNTD